jgi:vacuolar-type H+-ATPase catalytic subunit A/Vma1
MRDQPNRPDFERLADAAKRRSDDADDAFMFGEGSAIAAIAADIDALRAMANHFRSMAVNENAPDDLRERAAQVAREIDQTIDEFPVIPEED